VTYLSHLAREFDISIVGTIVHADSQGLPETSPFAHLYTSSERDIASWSAFVRSNPVTNHSPKLRNVAFFIEGGTGNLVDEYAKRNLWHPERDYLIPGDAGHQVFDTKWGRCAFLICESPSPNWTFR
jgi:predicted amidohydrolase